MSMTLEHAKVFLSMGDDVQLHLWFNSGSMITILFKAEDYDEETFDEKFNLLVRGHEWKLEKDNGVGLETLR